MSNSELASYARSSVSIGEGLEPVPDFDLISRDGLKLPLFTDEAMVNYLQGANSDFSYCTKEILSASNGVQWSAESGYPESIAIENYVPPTVNTYRQCFD